MAAITAALTLLAVGCSPSRPVSALTPAGQIVSTSAADASPDAKASVASSPSAPRYPDPRPKVAVLARLAAGANVSAAKVWSTTTDPIAWTIEPAGDVRDGVVHADLISVDARAKTVSFDATQLYKGASADVEAARDKTDLGDLGYQYERNSHVHVQRASLSGTAVVLLQLAGASDNPPPARSDFGRMFVSSPADLLRRDHLGAFPDFWVVLQRGQVVALVEMFQS